MKPTEGRKLVRQKKPIKVEKDKCVTLNHLGIEPNNKYMNSPEQRSLNNGETGIIFQSI